MMMLTTTVQSALVSLSRAARPSEACGYLILPDQVRALTNLSPTPAESFEHDWEPIQFMASLHGREKLVLWHSHPRTRAVWSLADLQIMQWTKLPMLIVSLKATAPLIRVYVWNERCAGPMEVVSYRVEERQALQNPQTVVEASARTDRSVTEEPRG